MEETPESYLSDSDSVQAVRASASVGTVTRPGCFCSAATAAPTCSPASVVQLSQPSAAPAAAPAAPAPTCDLFGVVTLCGHDEGGECGVAVVDLGALQRETWLHSHSGPPRPVPVEGRPIKPPRKRTEYPSDTQFKEIKYVNDNGTVWLQKKSGNQYWTEPERQTHATQRAQSDETVALHRRIVLTIEHFRMLWLCSNVQSGIVAPPSALVPALASAALPHVWPTRFRWIDPRRPHPGDPHRSSCVRLSPLLLVLLLLRLLLLLLLLPRLHLRLRLHASGTKTTSSTAASSERRCTLTTISRTMAKPSWSSRPARSSGRMRP